MGGNGASKFGSLREEQARLIDFVQNRTAVVHVYKHMASQGPIVHVSEEEAKLLDTEAGVLSVFPNKTVQLHTTRSWSFLEHHHNFGDSISATSYPGSNANGSDIIIFVIDSGIWPESKSFVDEDRVVFTFRLTWNDGEELVKKRRNSLLLAAIGTCILFIMKIIGARNFDKSNQECRDFFGHDSHTASTAAGAAVAGVSYYGLAAETTIGGSPNSRIAVYKACQSLGCSESAILAAIHDGVDVMSLSPREADTIFGLSRWPLVDFMLLNM
ncbi:subtilisin-like protease SBT5.1 [Daucus carota subsp. sativus]|uniref:subtilisin-like protease SBT5.1 n=1 Tax=Daucus carota subsp. sativus TaxID=79200 RepID=UPI0030828C19